MAVPRRRNFTIRSAGALFLLSAGLELFSLGSSVPHLGASGQGAGASAYHLAYAVLFAAIGVGLWAMKPWGPRIFYVGTALYTLDRLGSVWNRDALAAAVIDQLRAYGELSQVVPVDLVVRLLVWVNVALVAGWWGFAAYLYWKRDLFRSGGDAP